MKNKTRILYEKILKRTYHGGITNLKKKSDFKLK